jgi:hypothetical protein
MGVGEHAETPKKGPPKKIKFYACIGESLLYDGATTSKFFPARKDI